MRLDGSGLSPSGYIPTQDIVQDLCSTRKQLELVAVTVADTRQLLDERTGSTNALLGDIAALLLEIRDSLQEGNALVRESLDASLKIRRGMADVCARIREDVDERRSGRREPGERSRP